MFDVGEEDRSFLRIRFVQGGRVLHLTKEEIMDFNIYCSRLKVSSGPVLSSGPVFVQGPVFSIESICCSMFMVREEGQEFSLRIKIKASRGDRSFI